MFIAFNVAAKAINFANIQGNNNQVVRLPTLLPVLMAQAVRPVAPDTSKPTRYAQGHRR